MADEMRFNQLRRKFHPVLMEMDRRGVRLDQLEMRNNKLYLRATAPTREDMNYLWDEIRMIDQDLVDLTAEIAVGQIAAGAGAPRAADIEARRTTVPDPDRTRDAGDRRHGPGRA